MKFPLLMFASLLFVCPLLGQQSADLTVTLSTGKVITFQSAEQKLRFLNAQARSRMDGETKLRTDAQVRLEAGIRESERKATEDRLSERSHMFYVHVLEIRDDWVVATLSDFHVDHDTLTPFEGSPLPGKALIKWNPPKDLLTGSTVFLRLFDCDVLDIGGGQRVRRMAHEPAEAEQLLFGTKTLGTVKP